MPIDSITVHLTDGIKQGDYAPNKVYDLTAYLSNPTDAELQSAVALIVRTGERFLGRAAPAPTGEVIATATALPPTSSASQASPSEPVGEPQRRTRRTRAQIEADAAAAAAAQSGSASQDAASDPQSAPAAAAGSYTSGSATDVSTVIAVETPGQPASSQPSAASQEDDEWAAAAPETLTITDQELNHACSVTAERVKDPAKVKGVIANFNPGGDAFDPAKPGGRRFTVNDIPANQRADFLAQLKALT